MRALPRQKRARNQLLKIVPRLKFVRDILLSLLLLYLSPVSEPLNIYVNFLHGAKLKTIPDYHSCRFRVGFAFSGHCLSGPSIGEAGI